MRYDRRPLSELAETSEHHIPGLGFTHYHQHPNDSMMVTGMSLAKCERCGGLVQEPNAVGIDAHSARLHGLVKLDGLPPEGYYNDEPQQKGEPEEVCDRCYGQEIEDAPWQEDEGFRPVDDPGRRPIEGTDILFGGDFARVVLTSEWAPRQRATNPYAILLLYRTNSPFGKARGYLTTIAVQHENGDVGFVSSNYDLTAKDGAQDWLDRCAREGV